MLTIQQQKKLARAARQTTFAAGEPIAIGTNVWEESSGVVQVKAGFGASGCKVGSDVAETAGTATDPTVLLLHMDDTNLTDSSPTQKTVTKQGGIARSDVESKFGSYSMRQGSTNDYLEITDTADLRFDAGDFTIDFWVRFDSVTAGTGGTQFFLCKGKGSANGTGTNSWVFMLQGKVVKLMTTLGGNWVITLAGTTELSVDTWYHIAATRSGDSWKLFLDGVEEASATASGSFNTGAKNITICRDDGAAPSTGYNMAGGYIDEFRLVKGKALWTSSFTPPSSAHKLTYLSSNFVPSGTVNLAPASLKVTINGTERVAAVPSDLTAMDTSFTIDYSFSASGGDGVTGFTGTPITPTQFVALGSSPFTSQTALFLKFISDDTLTAPKISTASTSILTTKLGQIVLAVDAVEKFKVEADGAVVSDGNMHADTFIGDTVSIDDTDSPYALDDEPSTVFVDTTSDDVTVELPSAATAGAGRAYVFKIIDGANDIILVADGSETVEGAADLTITGALATAKIVSDGANWWRV